MPKNSILVNRHMIMYPDLSVTKRLYGGRMLSWMDESAAMYGKQVVPSYDIVTKIVSEVEFNRPGFLGEVVEFWCGTLKKGKTSITVKCRAKVKEEIICECTIVFVALDEEGKPYIWNKGDDNGS